VATWSNGIAVYNEHGVTFAPLWARDRPGRKGAVVRQSGGVVDKGEVAVFTLTGRLIYSGAEGIPERLRSFERGLAVGTYLLRLRAGDRAVVRRAVHVR
jgi:hypothetical protein